MQVTVTTRFVDRLLLAERLDDPDAADTQVGAIVTADPARALELVKLGFATPIGVSLAELEQAARDYDVPVPAALAAEAPVDPDPSDGGPVDLTK